MVQFLLIIENGDNYNKTGITCSVHL